MSMSPFTKAGWIGLVSTMALFCGAAVQSATADDALAQGTPFADGTVEAGALLARAFRESITRQIHDASIAAEGEEIQ